MKLPRDWLGPRSELVPFGPSADRQAAECARPGEDDPGSTLIELAPPASLTQSDFWGGGLDSIPNPVIGPEPVDVRPGGLRWLRERRAEVERADSTAPPVAAPADLEPAGSREAEGSGAADEVAAPVESLPDDAAPRLEPAAAAAQAPTSDEAPPVAVVVGSPASLSPARGVRRARRHHRSRRAVASAAAAAAVLVAGGVGQVAMSGSSPGAGSVTLARTKAPVASSSLTSTGATAIDRLKPRRRELVADAAHVGHVTVVRREAHRRRAAARPPDSGSAAYSSSASSTTYTAERSPGNESVTQREVTPTATRARATASGPTGAGAPFGPGTMGS